MTDTKLQPFEGLDVIGTTIAIRNAGDGLSAAMEVEPVELHHGETVHVVLECLVEKIRHDPVDKDRAGGPQLRVHMLKAGRATMIEAGAVVAALDAQQAKIDAASPQPQLPGVADGTSTAARRGDGPEAAGDIAADVLGGLRDDAEARGAINEPAGEGADLLEECPVCHGPVEDGRCLLQECDIAAALAERTETAAADPDGSKDATGDEGSDEAWENSARTDELTVATLIDDAGYVDDTALAAARSSEVIAVVGAIEDLDRRRNVAEALRKHERAGKARTTLIGGLEQLAAQS